MHSKNFTFRRFTVKGFLYAINECQTMFLSLAFLILIKLQNLFFWDVNDFQSNDQINNNLENLKNLGHFISIDYKNY